jgi:hypothetical protein
VALRYLPATRKPKLRPVLLAWPLRLDAAKSPNEGEPEPLDSGQNSYLRASKLLEIEADLLRHELTTLGKEIRIILYSHLRHPFWDAVSA